MKVNLVRERELKDGKKLYEIFTTPDAVKTALEEQGDYPEICITVEAEAFES